MGFFSSLFGCGKKPTADEWGLDQLKQAGDDLSKPHKLEFILSFPAKAAAEQAVPKLKSAGFDAEVKPDEDHWRCVATKTMVPSLAELQRIHGDMDQIAGSLGGWYQGWGTGAEN